VVLPVNTFIRIFYTTKSFLSGHIISDVCIIFRIVPPSHRYSEENGWNVYNRFLAYVWRYDVVHQPNPENVSDRGIYPEPTTSFYLLKKAFRTNGEQIGDIVPVDQIRAWVDLVPRFGSKANPHLTSSTSNAYSTEFWLNKYFNKELFYILS